MAPTQPVVVGTAFQVQYIITEPSEFVEATTPSFDSCRLISGPNIYKGNAVVDGKLQPIQNIAYTLVPTKVGMVKIGSIKVNFRNLPAGQSAEATVTVVPQPKASFNVRSSYTDAALYAPSSKKDVDKLIDQNLFVKAVVDKKVCYEGEPVVATFKLYSRLQSSSEAEKSPAFYGFSVTDVLNINEAHTAVETVNGKIFNTSVLRQVQLYPVQAGQLVIDEMYVHNEIEFEDSMTHQKTKVEKEIITQPIAITVKPLPAKKPEDFTGAVGSFRVEAHLQKNKIPLNGQGKLIVSISGKGNFIQFGQPIIHWPEGIEPFEPTVTEEVSKNTTPVEGKRVYEFGFAVDTVGNYTLQPLSFSYFDMATASFKKLVTDSLHLNVVEAKNKLVDGTVKQQKPTSYMWMIFLLIAVGSVALVLYQLKKKKPQPKAIIAEPAKPSYAQQMAALNLNTASETQVCLEIQKLLSAVLKDHALSLSAQQKEEMQCILQECQLAIYSRAALHDKKMELVMRTMKVLQGV